MKKKTNILIADDHAAVGAGVQALLERQAAMEVCGVAASGREAIDLCLKLRPHVLVLDWSLPDMNGLEVVRDLKRLGAETEIVIFSAHPAEQMVEEILAAGAKSYVCKTDEARHLVAAIEAGREHKPYFTPAVSEILFARIENTRADEAAGRRKLTAREREILQLVAAGCSNKDAAARLGLSIRTVETHRASVMRKLQLQTVPELVRYALRHGIIRE